MANARFLSGVLFVLAGIYFLANPSSLAVVKGSIWEADPEAAKAKQKRASVVWGITLLTLGGFLIISA